ncbi:MAG: YidB family protein [Pseudolabrys sp.]
MGLIDVLNGMQNGPRGQRDPSSGSGSGGMSPITMAILGLLAYKAVKGITGNQPSAAPANPPNPRVPPSGTAINANLPGGGSGLGDLLSGSLGGLLAGGAAGSILSSGLNDLLKQFQQSGQSDAVNSWVGTGPNKSISPNDLASALGSDKINALVAQTGMSRDDLLHGLSEYLPQVVDQLTPQGRLPTEQEAHRML